MASFDPDGARAMGLPVVALDIVLLALTALTVVVSIQGRRQHPCDRAADHAGRHRAPLHGPPRARDGACGDARRRRGVTGIFIGYHRDISAGGVIVLTATAMFFVAWLLAPRHGIIPTHCARRRNRELLHAEPEAEAEIILASPQSPCAAQRP